MWGRIRIEELTLSYESIVKRGSKRRLRRWQFPRAAMAISACGVGQFRRRRFASPQAGLSGLVYLADIQGVVYFLFVLPISSFTNEDVLP